MKYVFAPLLLLLIFSSCKQKKITTDTVNTKNSYTYDKIGWTVQRPEGWGEVQNEAEMKKNIEKGSKAIEEATSAEIDASGLESLLHIKKDAFNVFVSTIEPYNESVTGPFGENNKKIYQIMKDTYAGQGIYAEYEEGNATVDGLSFNTILISIYAPDRSKVIMKQKMHNRLINGYDVGITINYNNEADKKIMETMLSNSHFTKRN